MVPIVILAALIVLVFGFAMIALGTKSDRAIGRDPELNESQSNAQSE